MTEKNGIANALDKAFSSLAKKSDDNVLNMLPKPDSQEIGEGAIAWRWNLETCIIESVLATRNSNPLGLEKGKYVVNIQMPQTDTCSYSMFDDTAKEIGSALLSAWNWQHIWKLHAGDFLLEILSKEPELRAPEMFVEREKPEIVEVDPMMVVPGTPGTIDVEPEAVRTTPTFDNG